jgi:hypothetical protein
MESLQDILLASLEKFYNTTDENHIDILKTLLELRGPKKRYEGVSLRLIDWFVTNYSKKNGISFSVNNAAFFVHSEYKSQLKSFSKKYFDIFKRGTRIDFHGVETALCQLNFIRWAIRSGIIDYCADHLAEIDSDMDKTIASSPRSMKKRTHLTRNPSGVTTSLIRTRINFA